MFAVHQLLPRHAALAPLLLMLLAVAACGPRAWSEIHGPVVAGGVDADARHGPSPRVELGYGYQRTNLERGYGLAGLAAYAPLSQRVDLLAEAQAAPLGVPGLTASFAPALSLHPDGVFPGFALGLELALLQLPPTACSLPRQDPSKLPFFGCAADDHFPGDTVYPKLAPRHRVRGHLMAGRQLDCPAGATCADISYSAVMGFVLASHWLLGEPPAPSRVENPYPIATGPYTGWGKSRQPLPAGGAAGKTDAACGAGMACSQSGRCTALRGQCIAARHRDCRRSAGCLSRGLCRAGEGKCIAESDASCERSAGCASSGQCAAVKGSCAADRDSHCEDAAVCRRHGRCTEKNNRCIVEREDDGSCADSEDCRLHGRCHVPERYGSGDGCQVTSDEDCAGSDKCRTEGLCGKKGNSCVPVTTAHCARTRQCRDEGRCVYEKGQCRARAGADCARSRGCRQYGKCQLVSRECRAAKPEHCRQSEDCTKEGRCRLQNGRCYK